MKYQEGHRVLTPDNEQGFISLVYLGDLGQVTDIEVDILEDDASVPDDTTTFSYEVGDGVVITEDQRPRIDDITPIGLVSAVAVIIDGILGVKVVDGQGFLYCDGFWLSNERMEYLTGYGQLEPLCHHWVAMAGDVSERGTFLRFCETFDLGTGDKGIVPKKIHRQYAADDCKLEVSFEDGTMEIWNAHVNDDGHVESIMPDNEDRPEVIKTLAELRATGASDITLVSKYSIRSF